MVDIIAVTKDFYNNPHDDVKCYAKIIDKGPYNEMLKRAFSFESRKSVEQERLGKLHSGHVFVHGMWITFFQLCKPLNLVELRGIEPLTSCMPCKRAPSCATAPQSIQDT